MGKPAAGGSFILSPMHVYLCPSPELYSLYHRPKSIVIIVDIFRASTTMVAAFAHGAKGILPVASTEEAEEVGSRLGALIAAERNVVRCPFAQLGNDPAEYTTDLVSGREIVFTTTNGTRALTIAKAHGAEEILVGALTNLQATINYCQKSGHDVVVLAAGWKGQASMEDMLYAGAFAVESGAMPGDDTTRMVSSLWKTHALSLEERTEYIKSSEHYARLEQAGFSDCVPYCMSLSLFDLVLRLEDGWLRAL